MKEWLDALLDRMLNVPEPVFHLILGFAAALENLVPPIPADMVILFGGFLAAQGAGNLWIAIAVVWAANVAGALTVYALGRSYGPAFFSGRIGSFLLKPRQLASLGAFYHRYGPGVIFVSRFVPMFRSLVPAFAGVSRLSFARTAVPIAIASAVWYGSILHIGAAAGENWDEIAATLDGLGRWLYVAAAALALTLLAWWWRSRDTDDHG